MAGVDDGGVIARGADLIRPGATLAVEDAGHHVEAREVGGGLGSLGLGQVVVIGGDHAGGDGLVHPAGVEDHLAAALAEGGDVGVVGGQFGHGLAQGGEVRADLEALAVPVALFAHDAAKGAKRQLRAAVVDHDAGQQAVVDLATVLIDHRGVELAGEGHLFGGQALGGLRPLAL